MTAEELARSIGESPSCSCGCDQCGRDIYTLYRAALDQAAWIRELERRLAATKSDSLATTRRPPLMDIVNAAVERFDQRPEYRASVEARAELAAAQAERDEARAELARLERRIWPNGDKP